MLKRISCQLSSQSSAAIRQSSSSSASANPVRSILYVPGSDERKLSKIFGTSADCVVLDCEDGVALNRKDQARQNIYNLYNDDSSERAKLLNSDPTGKFAVRINAPQTELAKNDIRYLFNGKNHPGTVFIPKTNFDDDISWTYMQIHKQLEQSNNLHSSKQPLKVFCYMESAASLLNLKDIIMSAIQQSAQNYRHLFKLEGFVFGSDDFCADVGAERTAEASELAYARQALVTHCKAFKLKVIDMVYIDYKDLDGLRRQSEQGARMGFTGKQVIHPGQVDVTQRAFMPSEARIKWATGLVQAFKTHQASGKGAFTYEGQMIDMPTVLQAENVLAIVNK